MLASFVVLASCVMVEQKRAAPSPVEVSGVQGPLTEARGDAVIAKAVADAPDPGAFERLASLMETISPESLFKDNAARLLVDGPETFKAMLSAIDAATKHINLETYIFSDDEVGERFASALARKSAAGIEVRLIYDSIGSQPSSAGFFERMREAGVEIVEFHPFNPLTGGNLMDLNVRDHRKLLIVDGEVAFTGGININRNYSSSSVLPRRNTTNPVGWRDTHIEVRGPAVAGFQRLFLKNWEEGGGRPDANEERFFPKPGAHGSNLVRVLSAIGGDATVSPIRIAYGYAMEAAASRIWITQSYFGPDRDFLKTMTEAAARGIDVRIIVTGFSDSPTLLQISRSCYGGLLRGGVKIYESSQIMLHAKTAVIDGVWATVGSSNLDYRSFVHNHEVNAVVVGAEFGTAMEALFRSDMALSKQITREDWKRRPVLDRLKEFLSRLVQYWM